LAQEDYYYEIQLTNKQLVFYFMAGATGLILSFLAGIMVGRGLDGGDVQAARPVQEDRVVAEEVPARPSPAPPAAGDLNYAQRLEGERVEESLERTRPASAAPPPVPTAGRPGPAETAAPPRVVASQPPKVAAASPAAAPPGTGGTAPKREPAQKTAPSTPPVAKPAEGPRPAPGTFAVQVGAFKDKATADSVGARLKAKGFMAYVLPPGGADGLFVVRVGSYTARTDAELVEARLRDQEKFKPYIIKN
jgi:DedD protein